MSSTVVTVVAYTAFGVATAAIAARLHGGPTAPTHIDGPNTAEATQPEIRATRVAITVGVITANLAVALWAAPTDTLLGKISGSSLLGYHLAMVMMLVSATAMIIALRHMRSRARQARQWTVVHLALFIATFLASTILACYPSITAGVAYDAVTYAYVFVNYCWYDWSLYAFARQERRRSNRWALLLGGFAATSGLMSVVLQVAELIVDAPRGHYPTAWLPAPLVLASIATTAGAGGMAVVAATRWAENDPHLRKIVDRWRVRRAYRALGPLWRVLTDLYPEVTMPIVSLDWDELLTQRVAEIRDAQRRAQRDAHPRLPHWVRLLAETHQLPVHERDTLLAASQIADATRRRQSPDRVLRSDGDATRDPARSTSRAGVDVLPEARALAQVSRRLRPGMGWTGRQRMLVRLVRQAEQTSHSTH